LVVRAPLLGALAAAPDLDLLISRHRGETHSIGAAAFVASIAAWRRWPFAGGGRWRIWLAAWLAWSSHPLLDALSPDNSPPIGVMALWPFSREYMQTGLAVFAPIWRYPITAREIRHDLLAVRSGAEPRFFSAADLPPPAALEALTVWWRDLTATAKTVEHPFNAGLMMEDLVSRARTALNSCS